jgi:uncharacterized OB-fold protein
MNVNGPDEVLDFKVMQQVSKSSFARPSLAHSGFPLELLETPGMVRLEAAVTLVSGLASAQQHEKICGMPVEVVIEKHSDEVTLPNFRPRNSP